jgi:hypothetical protein
MLDKIRADFSLGRTGTERFPRLLLRGLAVTASRVHERHNDRYCNHR